MTNLITAAAIAALIAAPTFGAASTPSFEESLKAAEHTANGETTLRECIKAANTSIMLKITGLTKADFDAAPEYIKDQIEDRTEIVADLTLKAVDLLDGDYIAAVEGIVLETVKDGVFSAYQGKELRDDLVACFEAAK